MINNKVYFQGRTGGIGNRIEQLINIQEFCVVNKVQCNYFWNNNGCRKYDPLISFENIKIINNKNNDNIKHLPKTFNSTNRRTKDFQVKCKFDFDVDFNVEYDTIIHVRAGDRLNSRMKHGDFSNETELNIFIGKTIDYVNNSDKINTYSIVSDDKKYIDIIKNRISKQFVTLSYDYNISNEWLDYYYLTKSKKNIIHCCKFSSYSITASILANKTLLCFKNSLKSNLPRYKANIQFID